MATMVGVPDLHHWRVLSDAEIERIREAALRVLTNSGFRIHSLAILERLERRGLRVDYASHTVRPTPDQVAAVENTARRHAGEPRDEWLLRQTPPRGERVGHNFTCYYDATEGVRRAATLQDIRNVVRAWQVLPEIVETRTCMTAQDVPPEIEPIVATVEVMKLSDKIRTCPELMLAEQLPFLEELETIIRGEQVRYHTNGCSVNHFAMDERAADCLLAVARNGLDHWWVNSCPVAGANAPVTLAGATVVGVAETLGGWLAGWAMNEDVSLGAIPLAGVIDMRTTRVMFSTPETVLVDCALYQYFYCMYGLRIGLCTGYTDAKVPGMQAMHDKMLKALSYGLFVDHLGGQTGTLEAGNTYSPTQQMIDLEINREVAQLAKGLAVSDETLALDEIERFASDDRQSFLLFDHTLQNWRDSLWLPRLMDRTSFDSREAEKRKERQIVEIAEQRWRDALAEYVAPDLDQTRIAAAEEVLRRAKNALL